MLQARAGVNFGNRFNGNELFQTYVRNWSVSRTCQEDQQAQGEVHQSVVGQALHLLEQLESATYQVEYFGNGWF